MAELLLVPEVAAGATEVVLSDWAVQPGQSFKAGDVIAVVETDKAVVEVEAEIDATLLRPLASAGVEVGVGSPMALLGTADEMGADLDALLAGLGVTGELGSPADLGRKVAESSEAAALSHAAPASVEAAVGHGAAAPAPAVLTGTPAVAPSGGRRFISPIARKLLKDAGVPINGIIGTGPNGRVIRRDVESALVAGSAGRHVDTSGASTPASAAGAAGPAGHTEVPHSRLRKAVANRLTQSKHEIPHFYVKRSAVIDKLLALRAEINQNSPAKISVNDFIIRAVAAAYQAVPEANVTWSDDAMRRYKSVDISVAIASERGLVTPVVRGVEGRFLSSISTEVKRFVEAANAGRLQQSDLEGGTITVTNLGMFGVEEFTAIINPPQSAILAVGAGAPVVRVVDDEVVAVTAVNLVLSVDHRAIDGALAAQWMAALVDVLENPLRLVI